MVVQLDHPFRVAPRVLTFHQVGFFYLKYMVYSNTRFVSLTFNTIAKYRYFKKYKRKIKMTKFLKNLPTFSKLNVTFRVMTNLNENFWHLACL